MPTYTNLIHPTEIIRTLEDNGELPRFSYNHYRDTIFIDGVAFDIRRYHILFQITYGVLVDKELLHDTIYYVALENSTLTNVPGIDVPYISKLIANNNTVIVPHFLENYLNISPNNINYSMISLRVQELLLQLGFIPDKGTYIRNTTL